LSAADTEADDAVDGDDVSRYAENPHSLESDLSIVHMLLKNSVDRNVDEKVKFDLDATYCGASVLQYRTLHQENTHFDCLYLEVQKYAAFSRQHHFNLFICNNNNNNNVISV